MKKLFKGISLEGTLDFIATLTAVFLPVILIAAVWIGLESVKEMLYTDLIVLLSSIVFYYIIQKNKA